MQGLQGVVGRSLGMGGLEIMTPAHQQMRAPQSISKCKLRGIPAMQLAVR